MVKDEDDCYCDMRGMLSFLILFLLSKKEMNGQELAEELEKRKGEKPSPGTIYPALKNLREAGLIKENKDIKISDLQESENNLEIHEEDFEEE